MYDVANAYGIYFLEAGLKNGILFNLFLDYTCQLLKKSMNIFPSWNKWGYK